MNTTSSSMSNSTPLQREDNKNVAITLYVKTLNSQTYTLSDIREDHDIIMVRRKILHLTSVPIDRQRLIYQGKLLKDGNTIAFYKIKDKHTLHLVAKPSAPDAVVPQPIVQGVSTVSSIMTRARNHDHMPSFFHRGQWVDVLTHQDNDDDSRAWHPATVVSIERDFFTVDLHDRSENSRVSVQAAYVAPFRSRTSSSSSTSSNETISSTFLSPDASTRTPHTMESANPIRNTRGLMQEVQVLLHQLVPLVDYYCETMEDNGASAAAAYRRAAIAQSMAISRQFQSEEEDDDSVIDPRDSDYYNESEYPSHDDSDYCPHSEEEDSEYYSDHNEEDDSDSYCRHDEDDDSDPYCRNYCGEEEEDNDDDSLPDLISESSSEYNDSSEDEEERHSMYDEESEGEFMSYDAQQHMLNSMMMSSIHRRHQNRMSMMFGRSSDNYDRNLVPAIFDRLGRLLSDTASLIRSENNDDDPFTSLVQGRSQGDEENQGQQNRGTTIEANVVVISGDGTNQRTTSSTTTHGVDGQAVLAQISQLLNSRTSLPEQSRTAEEEHADHENINEENTDRTTAATSSSSTTTNDSNNSTELQHQSVEEEGGVISNLISALRLTRLFSNSTEEEYEDNETTF